MGEARATAVIAAAGSGQRLGAGGPKALVLLAGRPMIEWSLEAAAAGGVSEIVIAAPAGAEAACERALSAAAAGADGAVVTGGSTRAESVRAALAAASEELVLVHDAARPLAGAAAFEAVLCRLRERPDASGVVAAVPVADTLKREGERRAVAGTVPRAGLWSAQTPQGFRADALREAQERAWVEGGLGDATDDAMLVEAAGGLVLLEPVAGANPKVTTQADLDLAAALLAAQRRSST